MTVPRYTLRTLFALVTVSAIGSAALANPTDQWASVVFSGTLGLLVIALLVAVTRRGAARAGAIAFLACGVCYLGLVLGPDTELNIMPHLLTSRFLGTLDAGNNFYITISSSFQRIGHSLFALLFAVVGSAVARWLYRGEDESDPKLTPPEAGTPS